MSNEFFLASFRDSVGKNMSWNGKKNNGYPTDIDKAQVYSLEEAQLAWETCRHFEQPVSAKHVRELSIFKVDCQYIPRETTLDDSDSYCAFEKNMFDGNDVYWLTDTKTSTDFNKVKIISRSQLSEVSENFIVIPLSLAEKSKRRVFELDDFNPRKMVQAAGLIIPKKVKLLRRRKKDAKTRFNCFTCGKLSWQEQSYYYEGCSDESCSDHKSRFDPIYQ